jgi:3-oxoacyl-[acyl-carrier-protein] synthase II
MMQAGRARAVIAGGCDAAVNVLALVGFGALGVLSKRSHDPAHASRPFERDRDGFVLGEGAAFVVLEDWDEALRRGARIRAEVAGYASTNDGYRLTDEEPTGRGSMIAIHRALADADVRPDQVDYINAHGTATRMNDTTEARVITEVFGTRVPISSTKSMIGHALAAAGALEAVACLVAIEAQKAPPTINLDHVDPECALRHVAHRAETLPIRVVVKNSFGFGGQNACLVLRRP